MSTSIIVMDREQGIDFMSDHLWQCSNRDVVALVCEDDQITIIPMSAGGRMTLDNLLEESDGDDFSDWDSEMTDFEPSYGEWDWH